MRNIYELPPDLPVPLDDGGTEHLTGLNVPDIQLHSTLGEVINIREAFEQPTVLFIYPRAGSPLEPNTNQELWDKTPGARGCTPQSCGFRDLYKEFHDLRVNIFGLSIQSPEVQKEFVQRNEIPFSVLSDCKYELTEKMRLPTFIFEGERLIKRMALFIENGAIKKVFYPVFPPDKNASEVLSWLKSRPSNDSLTEAVEITSDHKLAFNSTVAEQIFLLTGADKIAFDFKENGTFNLEFADRGSISGAFRNIKSDGAELTWNVVGFGRTNEFSNVALSFVSLAPGKFQLQIQHRDISSLESRHAKKRAWRGILQEFGRIATLA